MRRVSLLVMLALLASVSGCGGEDEAKLSSGAFPGWTNYAVESQGFALDVPSDWRAISVEDVAKSGFIEKLAKENPDMAPAVETFSQPDSPLRFFAADPSITRQFATSVTVGTEDVPPGTTLDQYRQAMLRTFDQLSAIKTDVGVRDVDLPGGSAVEFRYVMALTLNGEPIESEVLQYLFLDGEQAYAVTYSVLPERSAEYVETIRRSADSFRLL